MASHRPSATTTRHGFGWKRDLPDERDHHYLPPPDLVRSLPRSVDLRDKCPPVYHQKRLNSCSANAVAAAVEFDLIKEKKRRVIFPSRLFLYYNTRAAEGTVRSNVGVSIRDAIKSVAKLGDCPESLWPYVEKKFRTRPPKKCYDDALRYRLVEYRRIHRNIDYLRSCLASGYPFVFGFLAHQKFEDVVKRTGRLEMPSPHERIIGHHAVLAVGYEEPQRRFWVRNSWGPKFGLGGYFTMPYDYFLSEYLSSDFWTIKVVT